MSRDECTRNECISHGPAVAEQIGGGRAGRTTPLQEESNEESGGKKVTLVVVAMGVERGERLEFKSLMSKLVRGCNARGRFTHEQQNFFGKLRGSDRGLQTGSGLAGAALHLRRRLLFFATAWCNRGFLRGHAARGFANHAHERCKGLRQAEEEQKCNDFAMDVHGVFLR